MKVHYNKLVRDRIPEIIEQNGQQCETEVLGQEDYRMALRQKLVEEAEEAAQADQEHLPEELADLWEVISTLMDAYDIEAQEVQTLQMKKRATRGAFEQQLRLLWISE